MTLKYFSITTLSDHSGLSPQFITSAIEMGELDAERCSGRWVIDRIDAEDFLSSLPEEEECPGEEEEDFDESE